MTQKEIVRTIIDLLSKELAPLNFKANIKEQGFIRKDDNAIYFYYFLLYTRTNIKTRAKGFLIEPFADINISSIERYYKEITLNTELKNEWDFITIGNSIANLCANPDGINRKKNQTLDLFVFDEQHLQSVVIELTKQFKQVAFPYFLANNTVKRVNELLNKYPLEYSVHMNNDLFRFMKGLIAAKLDNNPQLDELLMIYSKLILDRNMPDNCKEEMKRIKAILPRIEDGVRL
ncbi:hypothetical protein [Chitinophaga sp.]|uniref:hypothetical protein n=1 Tax=Chitinophaga sp. TaxID=1869181 RepID=UPI0031DCF010